MSAVTLLAVGKLKEKYYAQAVEEYAKRLGSFCRFRLLELPETRLPESPSPAEIAAGLEKEADRIFEQLPKGCWFCVLTPEGKTLSSEAFAEKLAQVRLAGRSAVLFDRLVLRHRAARQGGGGFPSVLRADDLPASSDARDGRRAALSRGEHSSRNKIP